MRGHDMGYCYEHNCNNCLICAIRNQTEELIKVLASLKEIRKAQEDIRIHKKVLNILYPFGEYAKSNWKFWTWFKKSD